MNRALFFCVLFWAAASCGPGKLPVSNQPSSKSSAPQGGFKLRHQILFQNGEDTRVFDGFMLREGETFMVRAFAGPGVDLFTVARRGALHKEILHIKALSGRMDISKIGEDIFRVYMNGCFGHIV